MTRASGPWPSNDARPLGAAVTIPPSGRGEDKAAADIWTFPPRRVLVAVDFGDAAARAVAVAGAVAERFDSALTAIHADTIEAPAYFTRDQARALERERAVARTAAERELLQFVRRETPRRARIRFVEDPPATAIVEASRATDLLIMGTHGRRGPSRWWLGSVAERVVREADVPVLVVRAAGQRTAPGTMFRRVVLVAGPWTFEGDAGRYAAGLAEAFDGATAEQTVACEEDLVRDRGATLLVVAVRRGTAGRWFGSAAEKLIRSCVLPMLFVPGRG